ncbi:MAG: hypothetical protein ABJD02_17405 [Paraglaciecola sp.]|uniref:hypothetical protein n=1 Tax=Paraglaciecola sp. TaxID=1920173 RepID=UPI003264697B
MLGAEREFVINYRNLARKHLKHANERLAGGADQSLKYAALDLRMAMEALTYDRVAAYKGEFPPSEYETWQPRKIMMVLLEIDPMADKDSSIALGLEEKYGVPTPKMTSLGTEKVLGLKTLKKHYDALGSYLHIQSLKSARSGKDINYEKIRGRCEYIAKYVSEALSSPVFNCTIGMFANLECIECSKPIRKRIPSGKDSVTAECFECGATYTITNESEGKSKWSPHQHEIECANKNCDHKIVVWNHELELGRQWECPVCKGKNTFVLAIDFKDAPN